MSHVLLDIDGVLAHTGAFAQRILCAIGFPGAYDPTVWDFGTSKLTPTMRGVFWKQFGAPQGCRSIAAYPGARSFVQCLVNHGHKITFLTAPFDDSHTWMSERRDWIVTQLGGLAKQVVFAHEKEYHGGDFLIDDKTSTVIDWQRAHPRSEAFLWDQPYNRGVESTGVKRMGPSYDHMLRKINERAKVRQN